MANEGKVAGIDRQGEVPTSMSLGSQTPGASMLERLRAVLAQEAPAVLAPGGKIDFDKLKLALGEDVDVGKERYGVTWPGKTECFKTIQVPSIGTLRPCPEKSISWDSTGNLIIEGDNLEVLKLLQKSYLGKVKMIYIDPPYNTGNDFIYPDNYTESLQTYLQYTGQVDAEGKRFSTNTDTDGRFHSKWLNMMYTRLYLARNLMREDGVVFISIDDNELASLRFVCDEVFGEENRVEVFSWVRTTTPAALSVKTKKMAEYILCYERRRNGRPYRGVEKPTQSSNSLLNQPNSVGELVFPASEVVTKLGDGVIEAGSYGTERYEIQLLEDARVLGGVFVTPIRMRAKFRWSQRYLEEQLAEGVRVSIATKTLVPSYEKDSYGREAPPNLVDSKVAVGTNENASADLRALMPEVDPDFITNMRPKPVSLISYLIDAVCDPGDLILDFFAGTGTTAQAVLELNRSDGGDRRFVLVQLPEETGRDDFPTISDFTRARLTRAIDEFLGAKPQLGQMATAPGFRVFKLDESNFTAWDAQATEEVGDLSKQLELHVDHVREGRSNEDLLFELLLKSGFTLETPIHQLALGDEQVYSVADGMLVVCLARTITQELIDQIGDLDPTPGRVVCLDDGFAGNDQLKVNANETFRTKGIESFRTV
jgi:adenine-specific DNA-methyltransferase